MEKQYWLMIFVAFMSVVATANAQSSDQIDLETTVIKGNTDLPKYLYVVPWQDRKSDQKMEQKLMLHNLYGDLFDPVLPAYIPSEQYELLPPPAEKK